MNFSRNFTDQNGSVQKYSMYPRTHHGLSKFIFLFFFIYQYVPLFLDSFSMHPRTIQIHGELQTKIVTKLEKQRKICANSESDENIFPLRMKKSIQSLEVMRPPLRGFLLEAMLFEAPFRPSQKLCLKSMLRQVRSGLIFSFGAEKYCQQIQNLDGFFAIFLIFSAISILHEFGYFCTDAWNSD